MERTRTDRSVAADEADGLLLARLQGSSAWEAVQSLRAEMQRLARRGEPHTTFVTAIAADGREVTADNPDAHVLAMGYRLDGVLA
jgi:hypothetical protein